MSAPHAANCEWPRLIAEFHGGPRDGTVEDAQGEDGRWSIRTKQSGENGCYETTAYNEVIRIATCEWRPYAPE